VANHPEVRPHIGGAEPLEFGPLVSAPGIVPLATRRGGFVFVRLTPGRYELHTMFLPQGRGRHVLNAFRAASFHMFVRTDCTEIVTKAADSNRPAQLMAKLAGFRLLFRREGAWEDGSGLAHYALSMDEWLGREPRLKDEGEAFHDLLERTKIAAGSTLPVHPDDEVHDRAAGAAALIAKAGQAEKAVWFYNRWALFAGYQTIEIVSEQPPVIDVRDAVVRAHPDHLEVLECR